MLASSVSKEFRRASVDTTVLAFLRKDENYAYTNTDYRGYPGYN
jgi:hypothetical protein